MQLGPEALHTVPSLTGAAVVTGATGAIGAAVAHQLAALGYEVIVAARHEGRGEALVEAIREGGGRAQYVRLQLHRPCDAAAFAATVWERGFRTSLLVNCAGTMGDAVDETYRVNLLSPVALTLALMPALLAAEGGRIVNVGSSSHLRAGTVDPTRLAVRTQDRSLSAYGESKLGLMQWSALLRAGTDLCVHDAHPGIVWTPMLRRQLGEPLCRLLDRCGLARRLFKTPEQGARAVVAAALAPAQSGTPAYFVAGRLAPRHASRASSDARAVGDLLDALELDCASQQRLDAARMAARGS